MSPIITWGFPNFSRGCFPSGNCSMKITKPSSFSSPWNS